MHRRSTVWFMPVVMFAWAMCAATPAAADAPAVGSKQSVTAAHGLTVTVRMMAPAMQQADLQIICLFKHKSEGDTYIEALKDFDDKLGGMLSALRNRGEFLGGLGETILFDSPPKSITPKRVLVIGLGDEESLSLRSLELAGRVALREAVRLRARHVAFAPTIRDQGNSVIDVGDGDRAVAENVVLAYDTEKRLQTEKLSPPFEIAEWLIEAGPAFYASAVEKVAEGVKSANAEVEKRSHASYHHAP